MGQFKSIFTVSNNAELFGRKIPKNTPILDNSTGKIYFSISALVSSESIQSSIPNLIPIGGSGSGSSLGSWNELVYPMTWSGGFLTTGANYISSINVPSEFKDKTLDAYTAVILKPITSDTYSTPFQIYEYGYPVCDGSSMVLKSANNTMNQMKEYIYAKRDLFQYPTGNISIFLKFIELKKNYVTVSGIDTNTELSAKIVFRYRELV